MKKDDIKKKASLSWTKEDYEIMGDEAPECVYFGKTEGEIMEEGTIHEWFTEQIKCLSVMQEEDQKTFDEQYGYYLLDLEYLRSLGKITDEELEKLKDKGNFSFGQK